MTAQIIVAGGGNTQEQQQQIFIPEVRVEVIQPPTDNTLLWITGILVPLIIFSLGIYINRHNRKR